MTGRHLGAQTPLWYRLMACRLGRLELDAHRVGNAKERADPGHDRVCFNDAFGNYQRQRVAIFQN